MQGRDAVHVHRSAADDNRAPRPAPGGSGPSQPSAGPVFTAPAVVIGLAGLLWLVFIGLALAPREVAFLLELRWALIPSRFMAGPQADGGLLAVTAPLFTHMLLHASLTHILMNSLWLLAFGTPTLRWLQMRVANRNPLAGPLLPGFLFVALFSLSGVAGGVMSVALNPTETALYVGASGGVSGLLGALVRFGFSRPGWRLIGEPGLARLTDRSVLVWTASFVLLNLAVEFAGPLLGQGSFDVAWEAHVGGYLFGLLAFPVFDRLARAG